ncbi:cation-independent mannose-6-phosphate receptor [Leptopilina heterotoma]|uniref:cation-independent mannose-6-phosphate receptor n=1 Tax=Leptopilina heterotoma TaxID=63436 RepID=UPI001CA97EE1|nr:cation-independent mannose-6-phosphate receptor [Leptopilina heterotoma]
MKYIMQFSICILVISLLTSVQSVTSKKDEKIGTKNYCVISANEKQMNKFDFSTTTRENDYKITTNDEVINLQLCKPLNRECNGKGNYSICLRKSGKEIVLGKYPPKLEIESQKILFRFTGEKCNQSANYMTSVRMLCDYKATDENSNSITSYKKNQCEIDIHWKTSLACGRQLNINCSVRDPKDNFKFDLSELTKFSDNYEVQVENSSKILLNVCHSLIFGYGSTCSFQSGSCLLNSTVLNVNDENLGEVNKPLFISEKGHLQLVYDEGGMCMTGKSHSKTTITFICNRNPENSQPKHVNTTECNYNIEWQTPLACKNFPPEHKVVPRTQELSEKKPEIMAVKKIESPIKLQGNNQINCSVTTKKGKIDLSPLILTKRNYIVKSNDSEFHINVCSPLSSPDSFKSCQGKAVCKIERDKSGKILHETSLGNSGENPIDLKNDKVILHYKSGAVCPENNKNTISTNISFECDYYARKSSPQYDKYTDCTYLFKWSTIQVCETVVGNFYNNCTISNPLSRTIDLSVLKDQTFYISKANKNYTISICGEKNLCDGSTICEGNNGLGKAINVIYEYPKDSVKLEFTKGTKCENGTFASDITFICNSSSVNIESPVLKSSEPCHLEFEWQTRLVCTSEADNTTTPKKPVPPSDTKDGDKKAEIASSNGIFLVSLITGVAIIVAIVIYLRDPTRRARCSRIVSSPCSSSSNDRVKYCRINTTEEARLLLDNCEPTTVCQSDSDDDLLGA